MASPKIFTLEKTQIYFGFLLAYSYLCNQMKRLVTILLSVLCLMTACQTNEKASTISISEEGEDSAAVYQQWAYQELFSDSLSKAETYAYRSFMLSQDSTLECGALTLLCYIYYREGKQEELQLLMQSISPDVYVNVMDVQLQVEQKKAGRQQQSYILAILMLLLLLGGLGFWYFLRTKSLSRLYQQRITSVRQELKDELLRLSETTSSVDVEDGNHQQLQIGETKMGIDVLFAIINDQNISQMGKQEEQAVLNTLPMVDSVLANTLGKASSSLTPKETFFCIMEYFGKNDKQKAHSFCCSEQAIRSTKSRLNKKIDIAILRTNEV